MSRIEMGNRSHESVFSEKIDLEASDRIGRATPGRSLGNTAVREFTENSRFLIQATGAVVSKPEFEAYCEDQRNSDRLRRETSETINVFSPQFPEVTRDQYTGKCEIVVSA